MPSPRRSGHAPLSVAAAAALLAICACGVPLQRATLTPTPEAPGPPQVRVVEVSTSRAFGETSAERFAVSLVVENRGPRAVTFDPASARLVLEDVPASWAATLSPIESGRGDPPPALGAGKGVTRPLLVAPRAAERVWVGFGSPEGRDPGRPLRATLTIAGDLGAPMRLVLADPTGPAPAWTEAERPAIVLGPGFSLIGAVGGAKDWLAFVPVRLGGAYRLGPVWAGTHVGLGHFSPSERPEFATTPVTEGLAIEVGITGSLALATWGAGRTRPALQAWGGLESIQARLRSVAVAFPGGPLREGRREAAFLFGPCGGLELAVMRTPPSTGPFLVARPEPRPHLRLRVGYVHWFGGDGAGGPGMLMALEAALGEP